MSGKLFLKDFSQVMCVWSLPHPTLPFDVVGFLVTPKGMRAHSLARAWMQWQQISSLREKETGPAAFSGYRDKQSSASLHMSQYG